MRSSGAVGGSFPGRFCSEAGTEVDSHGSGPQYREMILMKLRAGSTALAVVTGLGVVAVEADDWEQWRGADRLAATVTGGAAGKKYEKYTFLYN